MPQRESELGLTEVLQTPQVFDEGFLQDYQPVIIVTVCLCVVDVCLCVVGFLQF